MTVWVACWTGADDLVLVEMKVWAVPKVVRR